MPLPSAAGATFPPGYTSFKFQSSFSAKMSTMHCLVVCGATDPHAEADAALFGDFLGISMTLQRLNGDIAGTYLSCFPLDEHFAILGKQTSPPWHTMWSLARILMGSPCIPTVARNTPSDQDCGMWTTRRRACWAKSWLGFVRKQLLLKLVSRPRRKEWWHGIWWKSNESISDLHQLLHLFDKDVQLNIFASHCFSGSLVQEIASEPLQTKQGFVAAPTKSITLPRQWLSRLRLLLRNILVDLSGR